MKKTLPVILFVFFLSCTVEVDSPEESIKYTVTHSIIQEIVVPEVQVVEASSFTEISVLDLISSEEYSNSSLFLNE